MCRQFASVDDDIDIKNDEINNEIDDVTKTKT